MAHSLTRQNLHGIWVAIATPFDEDYCLVVRQLQRPLQAFLPPVLADCHQAAGISFV
jgi:hypothetical protein